MRLMEFNHRYSAAKDELRDNGGAGLAAAQADLRALLPQLPTERDRAVASALIDGLPAAIVPPPPPSALYLEALEIERAAFAFAGSNEDRAAAIAEARRRIWEIADRAAPDESSNIRALTRPLEHIEESLTDPQWDFADPPKPPQN
ncbi:hypothetical protein OG394_39455 [Kribbella sp. NBC_01245]|uniref:hypothetical protein n=1 Tax=Kribbella sp. NBC_01245 TaxID=2903578 RepID=UPI002E294890|nr:hypothetical protein [Kribbella sp. NBC_01245]